MANIKPDTTGEYIIDDISLTNSLNNANVAIESVYNFVKEFRESNPTTSHLVWINNILTLLVTIKEMLEQSQFREYDYNRQYIKTLISKFKNNGFIWNYFNKTNLGIMERFLEISFGAPIMIDDNFANFTYDYAATLTKYKNNLLASEEYWTKITPHLNILMEKASSSKRSVLRCVDEIKYFTGRKRQTFMKMHKVIEMMKNIPVDTKDMNLEWTLIPEVNHIRVKEPHIDRYATRIIEQKRSMVWYLADLHNEMKSFPAFLEQILSVDLSKQIQPFKRIASDPIKFIRTGEYVVDELMMARTLNSANRLIGSVCDFFDNLMETNPTTPHLSWIDEFLNIVDKIKNLLKLSQVKLCDYVPSYVNAHKKNIYTPHFVSNRLSQFEDKWKKFALNAFGEPLELRSDFARLKINFVKYILEKHKSNYLVVMDNWKGIVTDLTQLRANLEKTIIGITEQVELLNKYAEPTRKLVNEMMDDFIYFNKFPANNTNVIKQVELIKRTRNVEQKLKRERDDNTKAIELSKKIIQKSLMEVHQAMVLFTELLDNELSADPLTIYDKEQVQYIVSYYENIIHDFIKYDNKKSPGNSLHKWFTAMHSSLHASINYLSVLHIKISVINEKDLKEFNDLMKSHPELDREDFVKNFCSNIHDVFRAVHEFRLSPFNRSIVNNYMYNYNEKIFERYNETIQLFGPDMINSLIDKIQKFEQNINSLKETAKMAAASVIKQFARSIAYSEDLRRVMLRTGHLVHFYKDNELIKQVKHSIEHVDKRWNILRKKFTRGDFILDATSASLKIIEFEKHLSKADQLQRNFQTDLETDVSVEAKRLTIFRKVRGNLKSQSIDSMFIP